MKTQRVYLLIVCLVLSIFISPKGLLSAPYYEGKRMIVVVGFAPGTAHDLMSRMVVRYLPKYISGKPTIVVDNKVGGSSMIAANYLYNVAAPDGLTIGTFNRGLPIAQLTKSKGAEFDLKKFAWIGSIAVDSNVFCIRSDLPYKTFDELQNSKKEIFVSSGGPMSSSAQFSTLIRVFIKLNMKLITYTNMADAILAVERKEADAMGNTYSALVALIDRGVLRPVLRGRNFVPAIEKLPVDEDLATDKIGKAVMAMRSATDQVGRPFVAPPGTPPEVMNVIREAFAKALKDPQLQKDAEKGKMPVEYLPAEEALKSVNSILNQPEDVVKEFTKYITF